MTPPAPCSPILKTRELQDLLVVCGGGPAAISEPGQRQILAETLMPSSLPGLRRERSRTLPSPTTIAMGGSTSISACTATTSAWTSITIPFPISTRAMALPISCCTTKATPPSLTTLKLPDSMSRTIATVLPAPGETSIPTVLPIYTWPTISGEAIYTATMATEPLPPVSSEAGAEDAGAGMSACWFDFDNDGNQDIYVANMWSAAGQRVSQQKIFHQEDPENIRALYRRHARGNSLYRNQGNGKFQNIGEQAGVEMGRWAWCSDAWDFDHDGYPDLYDRQRLYFGARLARSLQLFLAAGGGKFAAEFQPVLQLRAGMERHQRTDPLGLFMGWSGEKCFLRQQPRRHFF